MALVHFYLHHKRKGFAFIRLQYECEDGTYVQSMKEKIKIGHWKKKDERLIPSAKSAGSINRYLDQQQERIEQAIRNIRARGQRVTRSALTIELTGQAQGFWEFFKDYTSVLPKGSPNESAHVTLKKMLEEIEQKKGIKIDFHSLDQNLADALTERMRDQDYADSTIQLTFNKLNALLNRAKERKIVKEVEKLKTKARGIDHGAVYTNPNEIRMMLAVCHAYYLPGQKRKTDKQRLSGFMYALGCQFGLRSIDFKVDRNNLIVNDKGEFIDVGNSKTSSSVLLPLSPLAKMILHYLGWKRPKFSNDTFREYIPVIAKYAGLKDKCIHREMIRGKMVETIYEKWEMIGLHTMRRSWFTNLRRAGADLSDLMKGGGWKKITTAQRYDRTTAEESAGALLKFMK